MTGGSEVRVSQNSTEAKLSITKAIPTALTPTEARVERDKDGRIVRVHHIGGRSRQKDNPLNDPLNSEDEDEEMQIEDKNEQGKKLSSENAIIRALEEQAVMIPEKKIRRQSRREREWIGRLVAGHGADFAAMSRDRKLNPMQQTEADIRRRVEKWGANGGGVGA
jgi:nucleolar protein 16